MMLQWVGQDLQIQRSHALPKKHLRGMIVEHKPAFMPHMLTCRYTIFIAAGLSKEWERFVALKELMHLYFGPNGGGIYRTDNAVVLENHINEMFEQSADISSHQVEAEKLARWMAIALLTPATARKAYQEALKAEETDMEKIAAELHIPVNIAQSLISRQYDMEISNIMTTF
ncbi:MAG: ImmA/IrrE family metallo-endopeptidase [Erythrobacter sp.]|nr:ImmA/IrrE family metallo-endopeptidase [Erythrobacter sp.]